MQPASTVTPNEGLPTRLPKGTELGDYVVDGWLRDGGMASIYRAHRSSDAARVALKLQLRSTAHLPAIRARFDHEAEAMRRVAGDPNVVELLGAGTLDDGRRYFVMEWLEGDNLEELLDSLRNDDQRLAVDDACEIGLDIAKGLAALHEHGFVHRDLKPANVMVDRTSGDILVVKLVDFGIVADMNGKPEGPGDDSLPNEAVMGTSAYMAPEQIAGHAPMPAMDVFALGVVLYEALTGSPMPPDGWKPEILPTIDSLRRNVPPELVALVRMCMSGQAEHRPRSATEVASQLAVILQQMRAKGPRLVSSDEVPIRTGGTTLTPRSQVAAVEEMAPRTGETEVVLTHEQVLTMSGINPPLLQRASAVMAVSKPAEHAREEQSPRPTRWWLILVVLMPVVAGVSWWAGSRTGGDPPSPNDQPSSNAVVSPDPAPTPELTKAPPRLEPPPSDPLPEQKDSAPEPPEPDEAPDEGEGEAPTAVPEAGTTASKPSRPKGPDKATCERLHGEVTAAKTHRDWMSLLKATSQPACWPGPLKLERRRLRVKAFAETGKYERCVKEGGTSSDAEIVARVKWCAKKLGT
jgi:serine/threonine protein kinase